MRDDVHREVARLLVELLLPFSWAEGSTFVVETRQGVLTKLNRVFELVLHLLIPLVVVGDTILRGGEVVDFRSHVLGVVHQAICRLLGVDVLIEVNRHNLLTLRVSYRLCTTLFLSLDHVGAIDSVLEHHLLLG